jgi:hypothetical protein
MARQRPTGQPTAVLRHPNENDIFVVIRKLTRAEEIDRADTIRTRYTRAIAIQNSDGTASVDAFGNPQVHLVQSFPSAFIVDSLRKVVENWGGIEDAKGSPIAWDPAHAGMLLEDFLDVVEDVPVTKDGKEVLVDGKPMMRKHRRAFSGYILDKLYEAGTFDADPKA